VYRSNATACFRAFPPCQISNPLHARVLVKAPAFSLFSSPLFLFSLLKFERENRARRKGDRDSTRGESGGMTDVVMDEVRVVESEQGRALLRVGAMYAL
jgi:hypothetical protein